MSTRKRLETAMIVAGAFVATGCHTYVPMERPPPGSIVRVTVPIGNALADVNAASQTVSIEGTVVASGDTLVLATQNRREFGAYREIIQFDTIRLGPDQQALVELQEFSSKKSIGLGATIAGAVALFAYTAFQTGGGEGGGPPVPPPPVGAVVSSSLISAILGAIGN